MNQITRTVAVIFLAALTSCATTTHAKKGEIKAGRTTLGYFDGLPDQVQADFASPLVVALAGGLIDFGLEAMKDWVSNKAKNYEVKSDGSSTFYVEDIRQDGPLPHHTSLQDGGALLFLRTIDVPAADDGRPDGTYDGLVLAGKAKDGSDLASTDVDAIAGEVEASLVDWGASGGMGTAVRRWAKLELVRAAAKQTLKANRARVLSVAAVVVVQRVKVPHFSSVGSTDKNYARAMQFVLAGYTYPIAQKSKTSYVAPKETSKGLASLLSLLVEGPGGGSTAAIPAYATTVTFTLKSDAARKKDPREWELFEDLHPFSKPTVIPASNVLFAKATLTETSRLKKTLESLAKLIGKIELDPADFGIEDDDE